jgi:hypothetical protein
MDEARTRRQAARVRMHVRIFFTTEGIEGEGVVLDLTKSGCRVQCEGEISVGAEIEAHIYSPDYDWPLKVRRAIVRWTKAGEFGVEFLELLPAQRERLRRFLAEKKFKVSQGGA